MFKNLLQLGEEISKEEGDKFRFEIYRWPTNQGKQICPGKSGIVYFRRFVVHPHPLRPFYVGQGKQGDGDSLILYIKLISFAHQQRSSSMYLSIFHGKNSMNIIYILHIERCSKNIEIR